MSELPLNEMNLSREELRINEKMRSKRAMQGSKLHGPYLPLMNHPELAKRIEDLGFYLKFESLMPRNLYQFSVLYTAVRTGVMFEFNDHLEPALKAGLSDELIEMLRKGDKE